MMNRKELWEASGRRAKRRLARCLLPAFLCAHIFIERETSGYEPVVTAIYPPDNSLSTDSSAIGFPNTYPLDSDLSGE